MAVNPYAPSGFREGRSLQGLAPNYATLTRFIAFNYGTQIAFGDPVALNNTGNIVLYTKGLAAATAQLDGIFLGCQYLNPNFPTIPPWQPAWTAPVLPAGTIVQARVAVDPHMTFYVQAGNSTVGGGGTTAPLTQSSVGLNFDIVTGTSGAPTTAGISTCAIDGTTAAVTATLPFRLLAIIGLNDLSGGVAINPSYNPTLGNQWLEVLLNTSGNAQSTGI